ncbi:MAG: NUDIX hydrolase [Clostridiales bacterium 43-6]|nr:MAG: NUDIX hydrolase [Clostridiales bacterium 43-6]
MEQWDIYDKNRVLTGRTMERGSVFLPGDYHLVVHVCIFNGNNEMLIQQRQPFKHGWSNMWDVTVGGSVTAGETSHQGAQRELFEEIGYPADLSAERPFFTMNYENGFDDFYLIEREVDITTLTLQYEEVQNVKWATKEEILRMVAEGTFIDYWFMDVLFEMRKQRGAIRETK